MNARLIYEGHDITNSVVIERAIYRDASSGRCDMLDITLDHAEAWFRWKPMKGDKIEMTAGNLSTGSMYLHTIAPEDGKYRIMAAGMTENANIKKYKAYRDITISALFSACAAESQMKSALYGMNGGYRYPYILRRDEGCAGFLDRLCYNEGAILKTVSGRYSGIDILTMQKEKSVAAITITADQPGVEYIRQAGKRFAGIRIRSPYADTAAYDTAVTSGEIITIPAPVRDSLTAGRWARGMLLQANRKAERLTIESEFNAGFAAMARIDVRGGTDADGEWIIDSAEHDIINGTSTAEMLRCIDTII